VPVEIGLNPVELLEGRFVLASIIDISDRHRRDEELRRSNAELAQFAYVASHDLQEPLRMVASYTELLAQRYQGRLDERADKYIHYAVDGARRMQQLVADLLTYSRVGSQGRPLQSVALADVLQRVLRSLGPRLRDSGGTVQVADALPVVLADEVQLEQLLQNLVGNALKFHGDAPPLVQVQAPPAAGPATDVGGLGAGQRHRHRAEVPRAHLPDVPAPARAGPLRGQRHRAGRGPAHRAPPRRAAVGAVAAGPGQPLQLHRRCRRVRPQPAPRPRPSAVFDAVRNVKPRLWPPGGVANPRDATGHCCGLRLASRPNPSALPSSTQHRTRH
jgi:hypothetical protein